MKRTGMLVTMAALLLGAQPAGAKRMPIHDAAESSNYSQKAGGMLGRGLLNVGTCFMDLIVNTVNETKSGPPLVGTLTGVAKGAGCSVLRLGSGAVDVVTFWVPGFNGFPVSDSYDNCLTTGTSMAEQPTTTAPVSQWQPPAPSESTSTMTSPAPSAPAESAQTPNIVPPTAGESQPSSQPKKTWTK